MRFLMVLAHGAAGPLDEFIEFGVPLILLTALYLWSNRKPKEAPRDGPAEPARPREGPTK